MVIHPFLSFHLLIYPFCVFQPSCQSVSGLLLHQPVPLSGTLFLSPLIQAAITSLVLTISSSWVTVHFPHHWCSGSVGLHFTQ